MKLGHCWRLSLLLVTITQQETIQAQGWFQCSPSSICSLPSIYADPVASLLKAWQERVAGKGMILCGLAS